MGQLGGSSVGLTWELLTWFYLAGIWAALEVHEVFSHRIGGLGTVSWGVCLLLHERLHSPVFSIWPLSLAGYSGLPYIWLPTGERQKPLGLLKLRPVSYTTSLVPHSTGQSNHRASPDRLHLLKGEVVKNLKSSLISCVISLLLPPASLILTIIAQYSFLV